MRDLVFGFMAFDAVVIGIIWCVTGVIQIDHAATGTALGHSSPPMMAISGVLYLLVGALVAFYAGAYLLNLVLARRKQPED